MNSNIFQKLSTGLCDLNFLELSAMMGLPDLKGKLIHSPVIHSLGRGDFFALF
jgi:hypothetical protein